MTIQLDDYEKDILDSVEQGEWQSNLNLPIAIPQGQLADFCQRHYIRKLSLFGSVLRDDFTDQSDVDFLVEFQSGQVPGYLRLSRMENELSDLIGRKADLRTPSELSRYFRQDVLDLAVVQYVQD